MQEAAKNKQKKSPFEAVVEDRALDDLAFRAAEMPVFQKIVEGAPNPLEAIRSIRIALQTHFPDMAEIPEPQAGPAQQTIGGLPTNEFLIAKKVFEMLRPAKKYQN